MPSFPKPKNLFFLLPWIAFIPWYGMLIAMLICWAAQGHPIYWFMHSEQFPVYISDIGATNLRPLFISCVAWEGLGYALTVFAEFYQRSGGNLLNRPNKRTKFYMPPWYHKDERNLIIAACVLGAFGEIALLMCTIFSTALYHHVHLAMVAVFVVLMFFSVVCLSTEYFLMGRHYALLHPLASNTDGVHFEDLKWYQWKGHYWNKFTISGLAKALWLAFAVIWAICFGAISNDSKSACFEWLLAFWFGVLFVIISIDFYMGSIYQSSRYFNQIESFDGYYKYDELFANNIQGKSNTKNTSIDITPHDHEEEDLSSGHSVDKASTNSATTNDGISPV
ncbi:Frag1/DRAM/Sfk1 family protein NDAI_0B01400 [Naumovozyma dairenensis CBS 421]|uniref:CWH43-like N-terminal domain-containing protein n=1 Tax=Naumovozyma dairenensis (strain ATCC 10597 / BCRC 20456 / CBS 421 / NBRC 0211 / NRRL Y-12639) TaxID=1071378 RepID=G0W5W3_NAUDC|nr:hypothetical protein NDAI_0B01400 [Naumovozyma dairenensis CBS 421]CCD23174.1 hypothetical protein NDAI_0B01400 [Naumovozyma dairenensis CBS 421]